MFIFLVDHRLETTKKQTMTIKTEHLLTQDSIGNVIKAADGRSLLVETN